MPDDAENTLIMTLDTGPVTIRLRPDLAPGHVEQDLAHFVENQAKESVDRLRLGHFQGSDQTDPNFAHNALQIVAAAQARKVLLKN